MFDSATLFPLTKLFLHVDLRGENSYSPLQPSNKLSKSVLGLGNPWRMKKRRESPFCMSGDPFIYH